jgi:hypothetical protein
MTFIAYKKSALHRDLSENFYRRFHFCPTHFVTINLREALFHSSGAVSFVDQQVAEKTFRSFFNSLNKAIWKHRHRRREKSLHYVCSPEKSDFWHGHILCSKPDHLSDNEFELVIRSVAAGNPYIHSGKYSVDIQAVASKSEGDRLTITRYALKQTAKNEHWLLHS